MAEQTSGLSSSTGASKSSTITPKERAQLILDPSKSQCKFFSHKLVFSPTLLNHSQTTCTVFSEVMYVLSWVNQEVSGVFFLLGLVFWIAHGLLGYSILGMTANLLTMCFVVSFMLFISKALGVGPELPQPTLPLDSEKVQQVAGQVGSWVVTLVEMFNRLQTWQIPLHSLRATCYSFLILRSLSLLYPANLLLVWVLAFGIAPLYLHYGAPLDELYVSKVIPQCKMANNLLYSNVDAFKQSGIWGYLASVIIIILFAYYLWNKISIVQAITRAFTPSLFPRAYHYDTSVPIFSHGLPILFSSPPQPPPPSPHCCLHSVLFVHRDTELS